MILDKISNLIETKNFDQINKILEKTIQQENLDEFFLLIKFFLKLDDGLYYINLNNLILSWKILITHGKIKFSFKIADQILEKLVVNKRIIFLEKFLEELIPTSYPKKKIQHIREKIKMIKGISPNEINEVDFDFINDFHEEFWFGKKNHLKTEIQNLKKWDVEKIKKIYEYILIYGYDEEVILEMLPVISKSEQYKRQYLNFLSKQNLTIPTIVNHSNDEIQNLKKDYDQLALQLISGQKTNLDRDERNTIISIKLMSEEDFKLVAKEYLIAFRMLGMIEVVKYIVQRIIVLEFDLKTKIEATFTLVDALVENQMYESAIIEIDKAILNLNLIPEEKIAFLKLKMNSCKKLSQVSLVKQIEQEIKSLKQYTNYIKNGIES